MKAIGYGVAATLCLCLLWSAARLGVIPGWGAVVKSDIQVSTTPTHPKARELWRYLPVLR